MRKEIFALIASVFSLLTIATAIAQHSDREHDHEHEQEQEKKQKYTCTMHPEVVVDHPGNCPKCGMKLVPVKQHKRPTPINREQASNAQGSISKVGAIDLNRPGHEHEHPHAHSSGAAGEHEMQMSMHSSIDLAEPMSREGSGTSWLPDSSPMYARMFMFGENMLMLHGAIFPRYTNVSTRRGDDRIDAPNWFMGMYSHPLGDSTQIGVRLMMSLDPLTEGGRGYPVLFQT